MIVYIDPPELGPGKTRLSADSAAAATSSTVENNNQFTTNDYAVFGKLGDEKTEIVKVTSVTGATTMGHTGGLTFPHSARTVVNEIKYNQAKVYSATSETGTYSLLTTVDLQPDKKQTIYDDTTGDADTWYKVKYYNETTTALSGFSDAVQGTGYTEDSLRSMTDEILEDFGDPEGKELKRTQVRRYLRAGQRWLTGRLIKRYPQYRRKYTTQSLTSGTATYDLPTRFLAFQKVTVNFTGTSSTSGCYTAEYEDEYAGEPDTTYYTNDPRYYFRSSSTAEQFGLRPTPSATGTAFLWYWDYPATMTDDGDEHGLPYGAREVLVNYGLMRAWRTKDSAKAGEYKTDLRDELDEYLEFVAQQKQFSDNREVEVTGQASDLYEWIE